jgi:hypothetical protein
LICAIVIGSAGHAYPLVGVRTGGVAELPFGSLLLSATILDIRSMNFGDKPDAHELFLMEQDGPALGRFFTPLDPEPEEETFQGCRPRQAPDCRGRLNGNSYGKGQLIA